MNEPEENTKESVRSHNHRKNKRDGILQVGMVAGVLIAGLLANRILSNSQPAPSLNASGSSIAVVQVAQPQIGDTQVKIDETGTVQVRNTIELSPQVTGRVVYVSSTLASGGKFNQGDVLFKLDDADYQANVERAQADLTSRQADLKVEQAEADVAKREWEMVNPGQPIPENVAREPQLERANAAVRAAEAALDDAQLDLARVSFSLPFDGRVLSTSIEIGQNLMAGQPYGKAYDPSGIEVSVPVAPNILKALQPAVGREAQVKPIQIRQNTTVPIYSATLSREDAEVDPITRLARVILSFNDKTTAIPGEFVNVTINGPVIADAITFSEAALQENRSVWIVKNGLLEQRSPELIFAKNGELVARPFDFGDGVVISPLSNPKSGSQVNIVGLNNDGAAK